jgi:2-oxoglutarate dehydrogenase E2 component (dihydrolipoamide succinyltransferase)
VPEDGFCACAVLQSAILGMHSIVQRPVVVQGNVVPRPMMYVALTYDHRLVDGREVSLRVKNMSFNIVME